MIKINWSPFPREIRWFGVVFLIGFSFIGVILWWRGYTMAAHWLFGGALGVCIISLVLPPVGKIFYWLWMMVAFIMGNIISRIVLFLIFYGLMTPVALFFKITGRDSLRLKKSDTNSYFVKHDEITKEDYYEHLF